ncbi:MAG: DegT/DnrJ/EryC1/StrS family aminotransferase [Candidatus Andersenbacteria bacterium]|nr:DegT/DnrJ/EryC1/StrS family aminotransferase [Candidatus Andersenbacteria bacterium]
MSPISISISPNVQPDDVAVAWHVLTHPATWQDQTINHDVAQALHQYLNGSFISLASSGRSALEMLLKAYSIRPDDEIIIQAFTCIAVPEPILWRRAKPIYADMLPRQYTIDPDDVRQKITPRTRAIIAQHTFGIPADMVALRQIADEHKLLLIEDCAHALGSTLDGKPVGSLADAAFFSFGRDKSFSSVYGGAIATKKHALLSALQKDAQQKPLPRAKWIIQQLLHPLLFSALLPLYGRLPVGQTLILISQAVGLLSKAVTAKERAAGRPNHIKYQYSPALAALLKNQLKKMDTYTRRRRAIGQRYMKELASFDFNLPKVEPAADPAWLRFPLLVKNQAECLAAARKAGMYLGDWYDAPLVPANANLLTFHYTPGQCPHAEHAAAFCLNLPTHPRLTDAQVTRVIEFTNKHAQPYYETL